MAEKALLFEEGLRLKPYRCSEGVLTVGVGRNLMAHPVTPATLERYQRDGITPEQARQWLQEDVAHAIADCLKLFGQTNWSSWGEARRVGCVVWVFQLGAKGVAGFVASLAAMRAGDWKLAAVRMKSSRWAIEQTPGRANRVIAAVCFETLPKEWE